MSLTAVAMVLHVWLLRGIDEGFATGKADAAGLRTLQVRLLAAGVPDDKLEGTEGAHHEAAGPEVSPLAAQRSPVLALNRRPGGTDESRVAPAVPGRETTLSAGAAKGERPRARAHRPSGSAEPSTPMAEGSAHRAMNAAPIAGSIVESDPSPTLGSAPVRHSDADVEIESGAATDAVGQAGAEVNANANANADANVESGARRGTVASVKEATGSPSSQASSTPPSEFADPLQSGVTGAPPDSQPPVYRTLVAPAVTMTYAARHGSRHGVTTLSWRPEGERYEARLHSRLPGTADRVQISQGGFDESGVAPHRFTDRRERGATLAANFQRGAGKITFSGPSVSYPLWMGSQDRLSWVFQLAAVVAAEPLRREPGGEVVIPVVDARGDARLWIFRFVGFDSLDTEAAAGPAARFVRDPAGPYDTRVEAWLDPGRHYLPARVLLQSGSQAEGVEWLLQAADPRR